MLNIVFIYYVHLSLFLALYYTCVYKHYELCVYMKLCSSCVQVPTWLLLTNIFYIWL